MTLKIRTMVDADATRVLSIYEDGIATGHATFEEQAPTWQDFSSHAMAAPRLVAELDGVVAGWIKLSAVSSRCVYRGVAELSVYVGASARGRGVGTALLRAMIEASEADGIWTLNAGIFPENVGSIALHEREGFRRIGIQERLGLMSYGPCRGEWRDVVLLERRSNRIGI